MDWNDIQHRWQSDTADDARADWTSRPTRGQRLRRQIRRRDFLETAVAILILPVFALAAVNSWRDAAWIEFGFLAFLLLAITMVPIQLWRTRRQLPEANPATAAVDFLKAERAALRAQEKQARWAGLWYAAPLAIGAVGFYTSHRGPGLDALLYAIGVLLFTLFIDWLNRRHAAPKFAAAATALDQQINALETLE